MQTQRVGLTADAAIRRCHTTLDPHLPPSLGGIKPQKACVSVDAVSCFQIPIPSCCLTRMQECHKWVPLLCVLCTRGKTRAHIRMIVSIFLSVHPAVQPDIHIFLLISATKKLMNICMNVTFVSLTVLTTNNAFF